MLSQLPLIKEWTLSWLVLARNKGYVLASALLDIVFLFLAGMPFIYDWFSAFVHSFNIISLPRPGFIPALFFDQLQNHIGIIFKLTAEQMHEAAGRARPAVLDTLFQPPVSAYTWQFLGMFVLVVFFVFLLFSIIQGLAWWMATNAAGTRSNARSFVLRFAKLNLLWFALYFLWQCLDNLFDLRDVVIEKASGSPSFTGDIVFSVILVALVYFALLSYPVLSARTALKTGTRKLYVLLPAVLFMAVHVLAGNAVVKWLAPLSAPVAFVLGAVILLVLLAWTRVYVALVMKRVMHSV
jgi:hypothetical protein